MGHYLRPRELRAFSSFVEEGSNFKDEFKEFLKMNNLDENDDNFCRYIDKLEKLHQNS